MPNLAYKPRYKEGYFPVPPTDHFQDLRNEMTKNLIAAGLKVEAQHHEVATSGQSEIDLRYGSLLESADALLLFKYIVKNTARLHGRTVTFMPKPVFTDNGSGMHVHSSLWKRRSARNSLWERSRADTSTTATIRSRRKYRSIATNGSCTG